MNSNPDPDVDGAAAPTPPLPPPPQYSPTPEYQQTTVPQPEAGPPEKSPGGALALSIFPFALGHFYLGLYNRAFLLAGALWLSVHLGIEPLVVFFWAFTMIDAFRQAQILNSGTQAKPRRHQGSLSLGAFLVVGGTLILLKKHNLFDFDWLEKWWPAIIIIVGLYLIIASFIGNGKEDDKSSPGSDSEASSEADSYRL